MAPKQEWLIIMPDNPGAYDKRMEVRPKHLDDIKPKVSDGIIPFGGATLEEPVKDGQAAKINGSCMVVCSDTQEGAMEVVKSDVYFKNNVWDMSKVQIYPFRTAVRNAL